MVATLLAADYQMSGFIQMLIMTLLTTMIWTGRDSSESRQRISPKSRIRQTLVRGRSLRDTTFEANNFRVIIDQYWSIRCQSKLLGTDYKFQFYFSLSLSLTRLHLNIYARLPLLPVNHVSLGTRWINLVEEKKAESVITWFIRNLNFSLFPDCIYLTEDGLNCAE